MHDLKLIHSFYCNIAHSQRREFVHDPKRRADTNTPIVQTDRKPRDALASSLDLPSSIIVMNAIPVKEMVKATFSNACYVDAV